MDDKKYLMLRYNDYEVVMMGNIDTLLNNRRINYGI